MQHPEEQCVRYIGGTPVVAFEEGQPLFKEGSPCRSPRKNPEQRSPACSPMKTPYCGCAAGTLPCRGCHLEQPSWPRPLGSSSWRFPEKPSSWILSHMDGFTFLRSLWFDRMNQAYFFISVSKEKTSEESESSFFFVFDSVICLNSFFKFCIML